MTVKTLTFNAGETLYVGAGNMLRVIAATSDVTIKFYRGGVELVGDAAENVGAGYAAVPLRDERYAAGFDSASIFSAAAQTVKLATTLGVSYFDVAYGTVNVQGTVSLTKAGSVLSSINDVSCAVGVATLVLSASASRRTTMISNLATNTVTLRVGSSSITAVRGAELAPGQTISLDTTDAVYVFNPGGVAQSVSLLAVSE